MQVKYEPSDDLMLLSESDRIRWAEALESGKYEQSRAKLVRFEESSDEVKQHCCLAVLLDINGYKFSEGTDDATSVNSPYTSDMMNVGGANASAVCMAVNEDGDTCDAVDLNDYLDFSFVEIARILRGKSVTKGVGGGGLG